MKWFPLEAVGSLPRSRGTLVHSRVHFPCNVVTRHLNLAGSSSNKFQSEYCVCVGGRTDPMRSLRVIAVLLPSVLGPVSYYCSANTILSRHHCVFRGTCLVFLSPLRQC